MTQNNGKMLMSVAAPTHNPSAIVNQQQIDQLTQSILLAAQKAAQQEQ